MAIRMTRNFTRMSRIKMQVKNKSKVAWWQPGMELFLRLRGWIGGPIIIAVFVGKWLDRKYHSEPWLFLLSTTAAFVISMGALIVIGNKEFRKIEDDNRK